MLRMLGTLSAYICDYSEPKEIDSLLVVVPRRRWAAEWDAGGNRRLSRCSFLSRPPVEVRWLRAGCDQIGPDHRQSRGLRRPDRVV